MKKFLYPATYLGALLCVTVGACGFLLLKFLPPSAYMAWVLPLVSFLFGFLLLVKVRHFEHAAIASLLLFVGVWGGSHYIWPRDGTALTGRSATSLESLTRINVTLPARYRSAPFIQNRSLRAPAGTRISVFRSGLRGVRWLAFSPSGQLFASMPRSGEVVRLVDDDQDGYAEQLQIVASGLDKPHGLAFSGPDLLVAGETRLYRLEGADHKAVPTVKILSADLPGNGGHWTRSVLADSDGRIYVAAGSSCNVCEEPDIRRATVRVFTPEGGAGKVFARGLRNTVGLALHPQSGQLWGSDNGRDMLGDDLPVDEVNLLRAGNDYGWPYCYGERIPDPEYRNAERCRTTEPPKIAIQAHSAPLGITFGARLNAPGRVRDSLLVAYHGSWNRTEPTGYKIVAVPFEQGSPSAGPFDVVTGWLTDGKVWGRPVALTIGPDGALYVSDDRANAIYRIEFRNTEKE